MFFVSTVPAPAVCLSALCSSVLPEPVLSVFVPMHAACVCVGGRARRNEENEGGC